MPGRTIEQQKFYNSRKWRKLSKTYKEYKNNTCERCGDILDEKKIVHHKVYINSSNIKNTEITMNFDNLELLCQGCHNREHFGKDKEEKAYKFDESGNLIEYVK